MIDQWRVQEAYEQFQLANHIRWINKEEKDPLAAIYVFHDRHGIAMTSRYRGNPDARGHYKSLVDDIRKALAGAQRQPGSAVPQTTLRALRERLGNSLERWADCELYGGAASEGSVNLSEAAESYGQARAIAPEWSDAIVMGFKQAIVLALNGKSQPAQQIYAELAADKRPVLDLSRERVTLVRQMAHAVLALTGPVPADGCKLLAIFSISSNLIRPTAIPADGRPWSCNSSPPNYS